MTPYVLFDGGAPQAEAAIREGAKLYSMSHAEYFGELCRSFGYEVELFVGIGDTRAIVEKCWTVRETVRLVKRETNE